MAITHDDARQVENDQWVIWNGSLGILAMVTIGRVEIGANGTTNAWLGGPYDMVGPFSLDELEACGRIAFAACVVMSRQKWQDDQVELRREAFEQRREMHERLHRKNAQSRDNRGRRRSMRHPVDERQHRQALNLPTEGKLEPSQIKAAFRRLAQKAHPDVGGSHEQFIRITEARNVLLERDS